MTLLEEEIIRYVKLTKNVGPRGIVEGMRNRWSKKLGDRYHDEMTDTLHRLMASGELELGMNEQFKRRHIRVKPSGWISFAWTTPALLEGIKTVTRRAWKESHASRFKQGDIITAYDKQPSFGGKPVAFIRLTQTPYRQPSDKIPSIDWVNEGFAFLQKRGKKVNKMTPRELWKKWHDEPENFYVIRFEMVEIL